MMISRHEIDFERWAYDDDLNQFRDEPSRDDVERDIRNWRGPIIPRGLLPDESATQPSGEG
jgi:hypothetical protein